MGFGVEVGFAVGGGLRVVAIGRDVGADEAEAVGVGADGMGAAVALAVLARSLTVVALADASDALAVGGVAVAAGFRSAKNAPAPAATIASTAMLPRSGARERDVVASSVSPHDTDVPPVTATRDCDESASGFGPVPRAPTF